MATDEGEEMQKGGKIKRLLKKYFVLVVPAIVLFGGAYPLMILISDWANLAFARPFLASALLAAIDVVLFLVVLALLPSLSWLLSRVTGRF